MLPVGLPASLAIAALAKAYPDRSSPPLVNASSAPLIAEAR
jgi:hypothetical protein